MTSSKKEFPENTKYGHVRHVPCDHTSFSPTSLSISRKLGGAKTVRYSITYLYSREHLEHPVLLENKSQLIKRYFTSFLKLPAI